MPVPSAAAPLTFLFTDVEGSTRLWEAHPEEMPDALRQHFGILQGAIAAADGEIVKETGDGVFAVFSAAPAAVAATITAQRQLAGNRWGPTGPLRVRMGLHTGDAIQEHGDFHGTDVNRCARLMATAHGGQVIVSESTYLLVRDDPPPDASFVDLGEHRLKDLARPERVHQVLHPELPADFPPLRSLGAFPNNLPAALSSFIGRDDALASVHGALDRARLVTLTGAGGAGKTRLALQAAADRVERHSDGAWLVDLAGVSDPLVVASTVASVLRAPQLPGRPVLDTLTSFLAARDLLIVLDNCEHLIRPAAELVAAVLQSAPNVKFIATSREPLNVPGEISWRVPSLSLPGDRSGERDGESEAVTLFVERAQAADPAFELTADNRAAVETICARLDGLPLAIELAAARVRAMSVAEIAARLNDRFSLLTGGARTALPRQRTLEAAVAWSYDLLDQDERSLFERLSIFAGSFTLAAVEEVCAGRGIERAEILDLLSRLVDKSLVSLLRTGDTTRYRLLETLRDYSRNRLSNSADATAVRDAHTRWAIGYAETTGGQLMGPEQARWIGEIGSTMDDLRSAVARSIEAGDRESGLRIVIGLEHWWPIGGVREARRWLEQLLADEGGILPATLGRALSAYGLVLGVHGDLDLADRAQERALAVLREVGDERGVAWATHYLAIDRWQTVEPAEVKRLSRDALTAFERLKEPIGTVRSLWWLILWELEFGDADEAVRLNTRLQELARHIPSPLGAAHAAEAAGLLARVRGDLGEAGERFRDAVGLHVKARNVMCLSHCLEHVALWTLDRGDPVQAAMLLGAVDAIREDVIGSAAVPSFERMWHERATDSARQELGEEAFVSSWRRGRAMSVEQAVGAGMSAVGGPREA